MKTGNTKKQKEECKDEKGTVADGEGVATVGVDVGEGKEDEKEIK